MSNFEMGSIMKAEADLRAARPDTRQNTKAENFHEDCVVA